MRAYIGWGALAVVAAAGCELALGLDDKMFCDDTEQGCVVGPGGATSTSSTGGMGGSGGGTTSTGGMGACDWAPPSDFEEEWEDSDKLATWLQLNVDDDLSFGGDILAITPGAEDWWFDDVQAPLVYRNVCGDFGVHVGVAVTVPGIGVPPGEPYHGAGILVRHPAPAMDPEHWLLLSHSHGDTGTPPGALLFWSPPDRAGEDLASVEMPSVSSQLVLCRIAGEWYAYAMDDCLDTVITVHQVADTMIGLPDTVQVGVTAHRFNGGEEVLGEFRYTNLFRPTSAQACQAVLDRSRVCPSG